MKIIHPKNIDFSIGADGGVTRVSVWRVKPDEESDIMEERPGFRQEVEDWAGRIGDAFRTPTADLQGYAEDPDYLVTGISFKSVEFSIYEVTFTGQKKHLTATMIGGIRESISLLGEQERSARWMVHADSLSEWLPKIGDTLNWAGADYRCETISSQKLSYGEWDVTLKARDMSVLLLGNPSFKRNSNLESFASAKWRVRKDSIDSFLSEHAINSPAGWAGENYIVTNISSETDGVLGFCVTVEARDMSVLLLGNPSFKRNSNLESFASAKWRVSKDSIDSFLAEHAVNSPAGWAGENYIVTNISSEPDGVFGYCVTVEAHHMSVLMLGNPSFKRNSNLESFASAKWRVSKDSIDSFLAEHAVNSPADWAGENYIITNVSSEPDGVLGYYVTVEVRDMSVLLLGNPSFKRNSNLESFVSAKWRINKESIDAFLAEHELNSNATEWAGDGYYVTNISSEPDGVLGYYVTLEARHVGVRQVEAMRREVFAGYDLFGNPRREIVWTGRWRVHRDNRQEFENITGLSAADWAEEGYIVTSVEPSRISDMEYEYKVDAKSPESSNLASMHYKNDRTNLASREDVIVDSATFILSAEQCGMFKNGEGQYELIEEWDPAVSCPFQTESPLAEEMIDRELLCALLTVSTYRKGETRRHVAREVQWANSSRIVDNADGHSGDWRKIEIRADILNDSKGDVWTKVTKKYMHAPGGCKWNPNFWR